MPFRTEVNKTIIQYGLACLEEVINQSGKCSMYSKFALYEQISELPSYLKCKLSNSATRGIDALDVFILLANILNVLIVVINCLECIIYCKQLHECIEFADFEFLNF